MNDLITRIQNINNNIESLKVKKIEDETNAKRYEEDIKECDSQLNELGYKTIEEAEEATKQLRELLTKECSEIESKLSQLNI